MFRNCLAAADLAKVIDDKKKRTNRKKHVTKPKRSSSLNSNGTNSTASSSKQASITNTPELEVKVHDEDISVGSSVTMSPSEQGPLVQRQQHLVDNERMYDVTLLGKAGVEVRATKYVLACQNQMLQERLYKDPHATHVDVGDYSEVVLLALKEFCYAGTLTPIAERLSEASSARHLVELTELAMTYDYGALFDATDNLLSRMLYHKPELVFSIYDKACMDERTSLLTQYSLDFIKQRSPDILLGTTGLQYLNCLEALVYDLAMHDRATFFIVSKWIQLRGRSPENMQRAQILCAMLRLGELLNSNEMYTLVARSGFIDLGVLENHVCRRKDPRWQPKDQVQHQQRVYYTDDMTALEGTCFQFTPRGGVMVCSILTPTFMPVFGPLPKNR